MLHTKKDNSMRTTQQFITLLCVLFFAQFVNAQDDQPIVEPGGRVRSNSLIRMKVPDFKPAQPITFDVIDPWKQVLTTGATRSDRCEFLARDFADGPYAIRFSNNQETTFRIDSEFIDAFRARADVLLRAIDPQRNPDGWPPTALHNITNDLQRWSMYEIYKESNEQLLEKLAQAEQTIGIKTQAGTIRILGSGAADHPGYEAPYRPFIREHSGVFMPPNAMIDFDAHGQRKLERWGYKLTDIEHLLISHPHGDHFDVNAIIRFAQKRKQAGAKTLHFYSGKAACDALKAKLAEQNQAGLIKIKELQPGSRTRAGELTIKAVRAHHDPKADPLCYIIDWHGATAYYGTDTGYPPAETLKALEREKFDVFLHEITFAIHGDGDVHMDTHDMRRLVGQLRHAGAITAYTRVGSLHQCKLGPQIVPDTLYFQTTTGVEFTYDGMPIPIAYAERAGK